MAGLQAIDRRESSRLTPTEKLRDENPGYRYRGTRKPDTTALQAEKVRRLLRHRRQLISFKSSSVRALTSRLNQQIAQALCDGLKIVALAEATELSRWTVRTTGLSFDDLHPSGLSADQHLRAISDLKGELAALEQSKAALERSRLKLLAAGRRLGVMDDYELAALSGLRHEHIRKMTSGVATQLRSVPA